MIVLVRHGEATHHTMRMTGGWTDSVLTERGKKQIRQVAVSLAEDFKNSMNKPRILASDLKRASASAEIIADALHLSGSVELCSFLREKNNGVGAGLTEEQARKYFIKSRNKHVLDHSNYPGGETRREFFLRTVRSLWEYADLEKEDLIVVAHKGTIQNIIFKWLGMDIEEVAERNFSVDILPASVSVLGINRWQEHAIFMLNNTLPEIFTGGLGITDFKYRKK